MEVLKKPYTIRGILGWSVVGPRTNAHGNLTECGDSISVNFLNASDDLLDQGWEKFLIKEPHVKIQNCQRATNLVCGVNANIVTKQVLIK